MKDLDFDELDKAVSSLMENAPKDTVPVSNDKETEKTVTLPETSSLSPAEPTPKPQTDTAKSEPVASEPQPAENEQTAPSVTTPPVAVKRSGRFMDVVHPSSDMRTPSRPASRTGNTLQPMNQVDTNSSAPASEAPDTTPVLPTPDPVPAPVDTPPEPASSEPTDKAEHGAWPDPIDMHEAATDKPEAPAEAPSQESEAQPDTMESSTTGSPFLPGAKVEKRPLGGPAPSPDASDDMEKVSGTSDITPSENPKTEDVSTARTEPMPAELGSDVLAIEAGKDNPGNDSDHEDASVQLEGGRTEPAPQPAGPTSIVQQYKVQESSGDSSHAAIYDSAADSHTLTHPPKKKSGWLAVVVIVLLILAGAGAGAYVYFSGML